MANQIEWEILVEPLDDAAGEPPRPAVRRLEVPGGWLYQVEHFVLHDDKRLGGQVRHREWHPPVFIADPL